MIVDSNEPSSLKEKLKDYATVERLDVGDYLLNDELYERKTTDDLLQSMLSGRLWNQLNELNKQESHKVVLAVTGNIWRSLCNINAPYKTHVYYGLIHSIATKYRMPTLYFWSDDEFISYLQYISKHTMSAGVETVPVKKGGKSLDHLRMLSLSQIPGISVKRATMLLNHFKSIKRICNATVEEIIESGIGEKSSQNVYRFFNE